MAQYRFVGHSVSKIDARQKTTGEALYAGDIRLPGILHGRILTSPVPHARLIAMDTSQAERLPGVFAVVTARDATPLRIGVFIKDRTPLATGKVRYAGEPVAAVAAVDRATAEEALSLIKISYEELDAVFDPWQALESDAPIVHEDLSSYADITPSNRHANVRNEVSYVWGDLNEAMAEADLVHEETYATQPVHAAYLEPRSALATVDATGKVTIWCSNKSLFGLRLNVAQILGLPASKVRIVAPAVGGDFGGKGPAIIEPICALLARKAGRPVRIELSREDEFVLGHVRHPSYIRLRTAMRRDGVLLAVQGEVLWDSGAYSHGIQGLAPNCYNLVGPYKSRAVDVTGRTVYTNNTPAGHVRGPGGPQPLFAIESQMDTMARKLGLDPWDVRRLNAVGEGATPATGHGTLSNVGLQECLEKASERASQLLQRDGPFQGIGVACGQWDVAHLDFPMPSRVIVMINEDGSAIVLSGVTDQGAGQCTVMAQIAAEELGLSIQDISLAVADTDVTPLESGTGASATTSRVGNSVRLACEDARGKLLTLAAARLEAKPSDLVLEGKRVYVRGVPDRAVAVPELVRAAIFESGGSVVGTSESGQSRLLEAKRQKKGVIDAPGYGVQVAKVEVDAETGNIWLQSYLAAQDAGFALNQIAVEGQFEGGVAQGVGYALSEGICMERGMPRNRNLLDYRLPTAVDVPATEVIIVEQASSFGPYGAKGVGELGAIPVAPAIANAIEDAVGVRITDLPITPEKVLRALRDSPQQR